MDTHLQRAQLVRWSVALATFTIATISLLYGPSRLDYPAPFLLLHASAVADSLILAATFYAAIGLILGRRAAWAIGVVILLIATIWETIVAREPISLLSIPPLTGLLLLIATRHFYPIASHSAIITRTLRRALIFTFITTMLGCIAFFILARVEHRPFLLAPSVIRALDQMYSLQDAFMPMRHVALSHALGRSLLFGFGVLNYVVIALALLRPVADTFQLTPLAHARALHFIRRFSTSSEDYFKYFPADKSYYFGQAVDGVVAYGTHEGTCIALADPVARTTKDRRRLLDEFVAFSASQGWQTAFLAVEEPSLPLYADNGFTQLKIGEAARVPLENVAELLASKNNRNIMNRFRKAGYYADCLPSHHSPAFIHELKNVSDAWLQQDHHSERQFAMGYFHAGYLQRSRIMTVRTGDGQLVAFASLQPNFSGHTRASIDLMRVHPDAPSNTMDFLFLSLMSQLQNEGWDEFDLGLAPLAGLEEGRAAERSLHLMGHYAGRWFSFKGLRRFKDKFHPTWQSVYIAYTGTDARLPAIGRAISALLRYQD